MVGCRDADHLILKFAGVPKGRLLVFRSLLLMPPPQNYQILTILMHNLSVIAYPESVHPSVPCILFCVVLCVIELMMCAFAATEIFDRQQIGACDFRHSVQYAAQPVTQPSPAFSPSIGSPRLTSPRLCVWWSQAQPNAAPVLVTAQLRSNDQSPAHKGRRPTPFLSIW
jgi:hypothetical protein